MKQRPRLRATKTTEGVTHHGWRTAAGLPLITYFVNGTNLHQVGSEESKAWQQQKDTKTAALLQAKDKSNLLQPSWLGDQLQGHRGDKSLATSSTRTRGAFGHLVHDKLHVYVTTWERGRVTRTAQSSLLHTYRPGGNLLQCRFLVMGFQMTFLPWQDNSFFT